MRVFSRKRSRLARPRCTHCSTPLTPRPVDARRDAPESPVHSTIEPVLSCDKDSRAFPHAEFAFVARASRPRRSATSVARASRPRGSATSVARASRPRGSATSVARAPRGVSKEMLGAGFTPIGANTTSERAVQARARARCRYGYRRSGFFSEIDLANDVSMTTLRRSWSLRLDTRAAFMPPLQTN
jgi:hypothetical protein